MSCKRLFVSFRRSYLGSVEGKMCIRDRVECILETGRTNQIRVHMKHIGHILFNDERYGGHEILKGTHFAKYKQFVDVYKRQRKDNDNHHRHNQSTDRPTKAKATNHSTSSCIHSFIAAR